MPASDYVNRDNADLVDELYRRFQADPQSVEPTWRAFFEGLELGLSAADRGVGAVAKGAPATAIAEAAAGKYRPTSFGLVSSYRDLGHVLADIDPLTDPPTEHPLLDIAHYSLDAGDLRMSCHPGGFRGFSPEQPPTLSELIAALRETYCGTMGVEYTGIGHHREDFAKKVGVPGMYDYLPQRASWFVTAITNWMGDDGVIKRIRMEARRFNLQGDTTFITGKVVKKYLKDGCPLVDIEMTGINQSGVLSSPGFATVMLPAKDVNTKIPIDGTVCDLELPTLR